MRATPGRSLRELNSFGLEAQSASLVELQDAGALAGLEFDPHTDLLLGGGSNLLLVGDVPGRVLLNRLSGRRLVQQDAKTAVVEAAGGENWHALVRWCLAQGLSGLENLSLIPGSVGAAPLQNIGAYGVELAGRLESLTAWDFQAQAFRDFASPECGFAYRDSRFKSADRDRFLVCAVRLRLDRQFTPHLEYAGLREALAATGHAAAPTAMQVSDAVVRLRQAKLPDPAQLGNAGSFFKNPVLPEAQAQSLAVAFPKLPGWSAPNDQRKLSAAWMLEHLGWKGHRLGDAGFAPGHALVLVNHGNATGAQLLELAARAAASVHEAFGLWLEPEPRIVGASWQHPLPHGH